MVKKRGTDGSQQTIVGRGNDAKTRGAAAHQRRMQGAAKNRADGSKAIEEVDNRWQLSGRSVYRQLN
ncbi:MAG TPA: hypothetical protein VF506_20150 [Streptosporangiaceae bacterium]